jgi:cellulose synthase/poly-beta-1,6-N-acetylglucosamine synthase-like glycosyltransferase
MIVEAIFWGSFGILFYVFFGSLVVLSLLACFKQKPVRKRDWTPSVSIVISAFNEEKHIRQKLLNCDALDYPGNRLEIIVVSDGSTDNTDQILDQMKRPGLRVIRLREQKGKAQCQNVATTVARNEILFFTDATVLHPPDTLRLLVRSLSDPTVGCVTGKPIFRQDTSAISRGLSKREKYEFYLRQKLGMAGSLFGAQDCIYAIPRELYRPVRADLDSGFVGPLLLLEQGYRTIYEPDALALVDRQAPSVRDEFLRRSRIALRGMRGLIYMRSLMNPFKHGFVAISLISTRLLRWLTPIFLILMLVANLFLLSSSFYRFTLASQVAFYFMALIAFVIARKEYRLIFPLYVPLYFCVMACSALIGLLKLTTGETGQIWATRR